MKDTDKKQVVSQEGKMLALVAGVAATVREGLFELVIRSGLGVVGAMLEADRERLCGPRYEHSAHTAHRAGHVEGGLTMGGRRVTVKRPRVRSSEGRELPLPTWERYASDDPLTERAVEQMLIGVATRQYGRSLEPVSPSVKSRGTSKSAVSRRFVAATLAQMEAWNTRRIADLRLAVLMIDGIAFGQDHLIVIALGIDEDGHKHVLGLREGGTENAATCTALLSSLVERGLDPGRPLLVVLDGGKALRAAVREVFGKRALVQRCQVHKIRNVVDQLPEKLRPSVRSAMAEAYRSRSEATARRLLNNLERRLSKEHPGAAASLREGLDETLTILGARLPSALERTLATTNPIENLNSLARRTCGRVTRWRSGEMILRWMASAMSEAAKGFHRLKGHTAMSTLVAWLKRTLARSEAESGADTRAA